MDLTAPQHRSLDRTPRTGPGLTGSTVGLSPRHLRVARWQGDPYTALVGPARTRRSPSASDIERCLRRLRHRGVRQAVTPALNPIEAEPFFQAGFILYERLHLLARTLGPTAIVEHAGSGTGTGPVADAEPSRSGEPSTDDQVTGSASAPAGTAPGPIIEVIHGRRWHRRTMLDIDARAFQGFWQFDRFSLGEALKATPHSYARIARLDGRFAGYAVTGRTDSRGYLQRLAVDPDHKGLGLGTALVEDACHWLRRRGVSAVMVNTQVTNQRALDLYLRLGFTQLRDGLMVLRWNRDP